MANLIEYIQSQIYENSTEDISGSIMQQVLTRMASDEGVVNVHTISGQTPFADYNNAQAARGAVPDGFKKLGLIITYKLSSGWYIDEFIGSATSGWSTASNWKCLGPISVSQNASTGKTTITIGSESYDVATQPVSVSQNKLTIGNTAVGIVNGVSVASSPSLTVADNVVTLTNVTLVYEDGDAETIYANNEHTPVTYQFGAEGAICLVVDSDKKIATRTSISLLEDNDILLLFYVIAQGRFISGLLLPTLNSYKETQLLAKGPAIDIYPTIEIGRLTNAGIMTEMIKGNGGQTNVVYLDKTYWRTPNYIKIKALSDLHITASINCCFGAFYYDEDFALVGNNLVSDYNYVPLSAGQQHTISKSNIPASTQYVKFCFRSNAEHTQADLTPLPHFNLVVNGLFDNNFITKNIKATDISGFGAYQTIAALVNVTRPNCCDAITTAIQDTEDLRFDYGVLALPMQYSNVGKPTRLIIYCHGAGANYTLQSTRFHQSIDARLWLSEGYAVLDMDADPYTDIDAHGYIPGALQSIESAYKFVIEHYNICADGILLAGKSMGGGMTFCIMESSVIPVIASCAIVPVCNYLSWWEYMNAARRAHCAEKLGFVGTPPTWTSDNPMTQAEWDYLYANYDKWIIYNPFNRLMANPPTRDEMFDGTNIASSTMQPTEKEIALWSGRVAKVPCPVKFFVAQDDTICPPLRNAKIIFDALKFGSEIVEYRQFETGGHYIENPTMGGFTQDVVNTYGQTIEDAPVVFAEILNFWRRYV